MSATSQPVGHKPSNRDVRLAFMRAYFWIAMRKHAIQIPLPDNLDSLSDEEIETYLATARDIAHLPPG